MGNEVWISVVITLVDYLYSFASDCYGQEVLQILATCTLPEKKKRLASANLFFL